MHCYFCFSLCLYIILCPSFLLSKSEVYWMWHLWRYAVLLQLGSNKNIPAVFLERRNVFSLKLQIHLSSTRSLYLIIRCIWIFFSGLNAFPLVFIYAVFCSVFCDILFPNNSCYRFNCNLIMHYRFLLLNAS